MVDKRILILGVGEAQENLIRASKELGYYTIVCDMRSGRPGEKIADKYYKADYMDRDTIFKIAQDEHVDGVISNSEPAMINVSFLVDRLGLPGNSMKSVQRMLSKSAFRELQKEVGVFSPESFETDSLEEAIKKVPQLSYPIIIKPSESSGSRGATRINAFDERTIQEAFYECKEYSRNNYVTLEEFIPMHGADVYNADVFLIDGSLIWDGWYGGKRPSFLPMVPMTKVLPPILSESNKHRIEKTVEQIIFASGLSLGEFNVETYLTDNDDVFVIEINPRQAGDDIPRLIYEHTGIDLTKLLVSLSVDDRTYYEEIKRKEREQNYITLQVVFPHRAGIYQGLYIHDDLKKFVRWTNEFVDKGTYVEIAHNAEDSIAYVDLRFDTRDEQIKYTNRIETYIYPIIL